MSLQKVQKGICSVRASSPFFQLDALIHMLNFNQDAQEELPMDTEYV